MNDKKLYQSKNNKTLKNMDFEIVGVNWWSVKKIATDAAGNETFIDLGFLRKKKRESNTALYHRALQLDSKVK